MKLLEEKIKELGEIVDNDVLNVKSFLNQQMDTVLFKECANEWLRIFEGEGVTKILTIEASGIGLACITASAFGVPALFAKKSTSPASLATHFCSEVVSLTHGLAYDVSVPKSLISKDDRILIIDDFLANGSAVRSLIDIVNQAGATLVGVGVAIEKTNRTAGDKLRKAGFRIEPLVKISKIDKISGSEFV